MLKTNSKKAREAVRAYILENGADIRELMDYDGLDINNAEELFKYIWETFMDNYGNYISRGKTFQSEFSYFAGGLPFDIFDYHYNVSAVKIVGDILEETEAERARFTESQAAELMDYLIFRECEKSARR